MVTNKLIFTLFLIFIMVGLNTIAHGTDYSFGGDTYNAQFQIDTGQVWVDSVRNPSNTGAGDSGVVWFDPYGESRSLQLVIYEPSTGALLDSTAPIITGTETGAQRYSGEFIEGATIEADHLYWIGVMFTDASYSYKPRLTYLSSATTRWHYYQADPAVLPASISGAPTTNVGETSMFVYFSDGGEPPPPGESNNNVRRRKIIIQN